MRRRSLFTKWLKQFFIMTGMEVGRGLEHCQLLIGSFLLMATFPHAIINAIDKSGRLIVSKSVHIGDKLLLFIGKSPLTNTFDRR